MIEKALDYNYAAAKGSESIPPHPFQKFFTKLHDLRLLSEAIFGLKLATTLHGKNILVALVHIMLDTGSLGHQFGLPGTKHAKTLT